MKQNQKLSPKYWVVHDTESSDVYLYTANKCKYSSMEAFSESSHYHLPELNACDDIYEWWDNQTRYKCELIEIKLVNMEVRS